MIGIVEYQRRNYANLSVKDHAESFRSLLAEAVEESESAHNKACEDRNVIFQGMLG